MRKRWNKRRGRERETENGKRTRDKDSVVVVYCADVITLGSWKAVMLNRVKEANAR